MSLLKGFLTERLALPGVLKIRVVLTLLISSLILTVGVALSLITFFQNKATVTERVLTNELPVLVDHSAVRFMENVAEAVQVSGYLARSPFVKDWLKAEAPDTSQLLRYLREVGAGDDIVSLHVIPASNPVILSNKWPRRKLTDNGDPFFRNFLGRDDAREFNIDINKNIPEKQLLFYVNNKIYDESGEVLGLADVAFRIDHFVSALADERFSFIGQIYIIDRAGNIKLHSDTTLINYSGVKASGANIRNDPGIAELSDEILSGKTSVAEFRRDGKPILLMTRVLPEFDWLVVAEISKEDFMAPHIAMLWKNVAISLSGALLSIILVLGITTRWVVRPLTVLRAGLMNFFSFLHGDEQRYEQLPLKGSEEMREMASEINNEVQRIRNRLRRDQALIAEMQDLISRVNEGQLSVRLNAEAASPGLRRLRSDINHMLELLSAKVGSNLSETMEMLRQYGSLNFDQALTGKVGGELGRQVHQMGLALVEALSEIKLQNKELEEQRLQLNEQNRFIESKNEELSAMNERMNQVNARLETLVQEKTRNLKLAYSELDTFLYRSSHDLRRPLTTLRGIIQIIKQRNDDKDAVELYDLVDKVIEGMDSMLRKLIAVGQVSSADLVFATHHSGDCRRLVENVLASFKDRIDAGGFTVTVDIQPDIPFSANLDLCETLLYNLVENAIVFSSKIEPAVSIRLFGAGKEKNQLCFQVEDNGVGIPRVVIGRCFDMFVKGSQLSQGDGLGLYVVKKIADRLGAEVQLTSQVGKGTVVRMLFPPAGPVAETKKEPDIAARL